MEWLCKKFYSNKAHIDDFFYCPYHPVHGIGKYRRSSSQRKPQPGMLLDASKRFNLEMEKSLFIGDRETDMQAGLRAKVGTLLYINKNPFSFANCINIKNLSEAIKYL